MRITVLSRVRDNHAPPVSSRLSSTSNATCPSRRAASASPLYPKRAIAEQAGVNLVLRQRGLPGRPGCSWIPTRRCHHPRGWEPAPDAFGVRVAKARRDERSPIVSMRHERLVAEYVHHQRAETVGDIAQSHRSCVAMRRPRFRRMEFSIPQRWARISKRSSRRWATTDRHVSLAWIGAARHAQG
jgi:hypothetical protein